MTLPDLKKLFRTVIKVAPGGPPVGTPGSNRAAGALMALDKLAEFADAASSDTGAALPAGTFLLSATAPTLANLYRYKFTTTRAADTSQGLAVDTQLALFNVTATCAPGGLLSLQGNFPATARVFIKHDNRSLELLPQTRVANLFQCQVPTRQPVGVWQVYLTSGGKRSEYGYINQAYVKGLWCDEVVAGGSFGLHGDNLALPGYQTKVELRTQAGDAYKVVLDATKSHDLKAWGTVPTLPAAGAQLTVWVDNGGGFLATDFVVEVVQATQDPLNTGIPWVHRFGLDLASVLNAKTEAALSARVVGDGVANDTAALQEAIDLAYARKVPIVWVPAGTNVRLEKPLDQSFMLRLLPGVLLLGEDHTAKISWGHAGTPVCPPFAMQSVNGKFACGGFARLTWVNADKEDRFGQELFIYDPSDYLLFHDLRGEGRQGEGLVLNFFQQHVAVTKCELANHCNPLLPVSNNANLLFPNGVNGLIVSDNDFTYQSGTHGISFGTNVWLSRNRYHRTAPAQPRDAHGQSLNFVTGAFVEDCEFDYEGPTLTDQDSILTENGGNVPGADGHGQLVSVRGATLTLDRWNMARLLVGTVVFIYGGKGVGQKATLKSWDAAARTLTLSAAFAVVPDATSRIAVGDWSLRDATILTNQVRDGKGSAVSLYRCLTERVTVAGLDAQDSYGILLEAGVMELPSINGEPVKNHVSAHWNTRLVRNRVENVASVENSASIHVITYLAHNIDSEPTPPGSHVFGLCIQENTVLGWSGNRSKPIGGGRNYLERPVEDSVSILHVSQVNGYGSLRAHYAEAAPVLGAIIEGNTAGVLYLDEAAAYTLLSGNRFARQQTGTYPAVGTLMLNGNERLYAATETEWQELTTAPVDQRVQLTAWPAEAETALLGLAAGAATEVLATSALPAAVVTVRAAAGGANSAAAGPAPSPPPAEGGGASTFAELGGLPADNAALATALKGKADLDSNGKILRSQQLRLHQYTYNYPAGQTAAPEYRIIDFDAAGYYALELQKAAAVNGYYLNDVLVVPDANGRFLLATQDRFRIDATAPAGVKGTILLSQIL